MAGGAVAAQDLPTYIGDHNQILDRIKGCFPFTLTSPQSSVQCLAGLLLAADFTLERINFRIPLLNSCIALLGRMSSLPPNAHYFVLTPPSNAQHDGRPDRCGVDPPEDR